MRQKNHETLHWKVIFNLLFISSNTSGCALNRDIFGWVDIFSSAVLTFYTHKIAQNLTIYNKIPTSGVALLGSSAEKIDKKQQRSLSILWPKNGELNGFIHEILNSNSSQKHKDKHTSCYLSIYLRLVPELKIWKWDGLYIWYTILPPP